jgi:hypothetical protein
LFVGRWRACIGGLSGEAGGGGGSARALVVAQGIALVLVGIIIVEYNIQNKLLN